MRSNRARRGVRGGTPRTAVFPGRVGGAFPVLGILGLLGVLAPAVAEEPSAGEETEGAPRGTFDESLTVTDTRLRLEPRELERVPAHVTVVPEERIRAAGAATLQDLLALEAGAIVFDQVGNGLSKVFDLRGFAGGAGTRVFLDGAPLNEPRNNGVALELVPLEALDRVEITRGSAAALAGGGSQAGVINLWTRSEAGFGGSLRLGAGDFGTVDLAAAVHGDLGGPDFLVAASRLETDGFRRNSAAELERAAGKLGWSLGEEGRLEISLLDAISDFGAPGALTSEELEEDRQQAPFNLLDGAVEELTQLSLNYTTPLGRRTDLALNVFGRDRANGALTTGRSAPVFGGFFLESESEVVGSTVQVEREYGPADLSHTLAVGVELLDGETHSRGFSTSPADPGALPDGPPGTDNLAERRTLALFARSVWQPSREWSLLLGARYDADRVGYEERLPVPLNDGSREFEELSLRGGVSWNPGDAWGLYFSYGEAFLPPTVEDLFSFPLFGSNPELRPEDSRSWELGFRRRWQDRARLDAALFRIDTTDEIVFDPDSPLGLFGANVNAGEARRQGLEVSFRAGLAPRLTAFANLTLLEAEFRNGEARGRSLPLTPEERLAVGIEVDLPAAASLRLQALHVGEQVLDNDDANLQPPLGAYTVVDARLAWRPFEGGGGPGEDLALFVDARNLLDEEYATRGIFAFDFSSFQNDTFLTPAPGRSILGGVGWEF